MGGVVTFGEADTAPAIAVTMRDVRCAMVIDPDRRGLAPEVMKAVGSAHQNTAGIYGTVTLIGRVAVGQTRHHLFVLSRICLAPVRPNDGPPPTTSNGLVTISTKGANPFTTYQPNNATDIWMSNARTTTRRRSAPVSYVLRPTTSFVQGTRAGCVQGTRAGWTLSVRTV